MAAATEQMRTILTAYRQLGPLSPRTNPLSVARLSPGLSQAAAVVYGQHFTKRALSAMPVAVERIEHRMAGEHDTNPMLRLYFPRGQAPEGGWPILVYAHGGAFVLGSLDSADGACRSLTDASGCITISVAYRLAPEHPWPAAVEDMTAGYCWALANAREIGGNSSRVVVGGDCAGATLAAVLCLIVKRHNLPVPLHQLLIHPIVDLTEIDRGEGMEEESLIYDRETLRQFYDAYAPSGTDRTNPEVSPIFADLSGLPPATVVSAGIDLLCEDGAQYAERLRLAGVPVEHRRYDGVTHGFFGLKGVLDEASDAVELAGEQLIRAFRSGAERPVQASELVTGRAGPVLVEHA